MPNKTIGDDNLQYNGYLSNDQAQDTKIYANAVKTIFNEWGNDAWTSLLILGYSLSSPFIQKLGIKRNPIIALTGRSGYGKSTLIRFALSAWGDGTQKPFTIEGSVRTTPTGFNQNIAGLNGLPCFFDEINLADKHKGNAIKWCDAAMAFANGQGRLIGSKDNELQAKGGNRIKGVLFGAGESLPDLKVEGVFNRQLVINVTENPPLGVAGRVGIKQNPVGHKRAELLEDAVDYGAGVLGIEFTEYVLSQWNSFESDYKTLRNQWGRAFNEHTDGVCLCVATLHYLANLLGINNREPIQAITENIKKFFVSYQQQENHPAILAIEELSALIATSEQATKYVGGTDGAVDLPYYKLGNQPFFWTKDDHYIIPANSEVLKKLGDLKPFYNKWREIGFVVPDGEGNATQKQRSKINKAATPPRCLVIPKSFFDESEFVPPVPPPKIEVVQKKVNDNKAVPPVPVVPLENKQSSHLSLNRIIGEQNINYIDEKKIGGTGGTSGTSLIINNKTGGTEKIPTGTGGTTGTTQSENSGDNGGNGGNALKPEQKQASNLSPTLSPTLSPEQNQANISGGHGDLTPPDWFNDLHNQSTNPSPTNQTQAIDPNKFLTKRINQYLKKTKNGVSGLDDLLRSLDEKEQIVRDHVKYLANQNLICYYDNQNGYESVSLIAE